MIAIKSIHKSFGKKQVLKGIDLSFERGLIHGIVGENGAGKTTLFRTLAGIESYEGSIDFEKGITNGNIGFLPTTPYILSRITGVEYLQLLCNARNIKVDNLKDKNVFNLPLQEYAAQYSTGMKKKLALTAIFLQKNEVFLLDEPFNGLDLQSNLLLKDIILKLRGLNKIIIISSHIFSTLSEICDHLHHLNDGDIIDSAGKSHFSRIEQKMKNDDFRNRIEMLDFE